MATIRLHARLVAAGLGLAAIVGLAVAMSFATGDIDARTLTGEFTITESQVARFDREVHDALARATPDPLESDLGLCLQLAKAVDVAAGQPVLVYDEAGSIIGQGALGRAESVTDARREPSDAFTVCQLRFRVDEIRPSRTVTIAIGSRRTTYRTEQLDAQRWHLAIPLGS